MKQQESSCCPIVIESQFGVKMEYIIISDFKVFGKSKGETLTKKELLQDGINIDALISAGHLEVKSTTTKPASEGVIK